MIAREAWKAFIFLQLASVPRNSRASWEGGSVTGAEAVAIPPSNGSPAIFCSTTNNAVLVKSAILYSIACPWLPLADLSFAALWTANPPFARVNLHARTINTTPSTQIRDCSVLGTAMNALRAANATAQSTASLQFTVLHQATGGCTFACMKSASIGVHFIPQSQFTRLFSNKVLLAPELCGGYHDVPPVGIAYLSAARVEHEAGILRTTPGRWYPLHKFLPNCQGNDSRSFHKTRQSLSCRSSVRLIDLQPTLEMVRASTAFAA